MTACCVILGAIATGMTLTPSLFLRQCCGSLWCRFIPAGNYLVTQTLVLHGVIGGSVIGTGETTVLTWKGRRGSNSTLIWSDGMSRSRMQGFVLDGTAGCDIGVWVAPRV